MKTVETIWGPKTTLLIRIGEELLDEVKEEAKRQELSCNQLIVRILEKQITGKIRK